MKTFIAALCLLVWLSGQAQTDSLVFENPKELMKYAYSKTDFNGFSNSYFRHATMELEDSVFQYLVYRNKPVTCSGSGILSLFTLMNWWDMSETFQRDSVLFPVYDHFFSLDESSQLRIPFYVVDLKVQSLKPQVSDELNSNTDAGPYRAIVPADLTESPVIYAAAYLDSFAYNNVILELNDHTFFSNTGRTIDFVKVTCGKSSQVLYYNSSIDLGNWLAGKQKLTFEIHFSGQDTVWVNQDIEMNPRPLTKSTVHQNFEGITVIYPDNYTSSSINSPDLKYSVYYACGDKKIRKPFIMVSGWGPHTDKWVINNDKNWPTSLGALVNQFNQEGLIENLHEEGFDVIVCQFFPPNAYVEKNAELLETLINDINNIKFYNGSYQENIIMGFSAGALATRLTLQQMEYKHLHENGPHPHTKLYISNDGEHGGANIPLGMQHAVEYLWVYEYTALLPGIFAVNPFDATTYALHYILNAPLSKQLLHYFHTKTGTGSVPGQGAHNLRTSYMDLHTTYNHAKNGHRPGYPSFQRMISISNGSSTPKYEFSTFASDHFPYPNETGSVFFRQNGSLMGWVNRRFEASFLTHGINRVFSYEYKQLFKPWSVGYEAVTKDPLVLDNAPGGIIFIEDNPIQFINDEFQSELTGAPDIMQNHLFSFTPTVLTHDVKDLNSSLTHGYPNYNFKQRKLMYDNEYSANLDLPENASNYYGYPHLGYPYIHYDYTVFDALFCWDENTEHLTGNRKDPNAYAGMDSPVKAVIKNFVVEEAEPDFIFLQNLRIGFFARPGYPYRVDYEAGNSILLGNHVTQKTDFMDLVVEPNAIVDAQAVQEIHFKPGVHIKSGADFHAHIGEIACEKSLSGNATAHPPGYPEAENAQHAGKAPETEAVILFPNPSRQHFSVHWGKPGEPVEIRIFNLSGLELFKKRITCRETVRHELEPGFYVVKLIKDGVCVTKNILVEQ